MIKSLINLFFPKVCEACYNVLSDGEQVICTTCRHELPITNFHFEANEAVKKVVYGRVQLQNATALLHFAKKGLVQQLIHNLKYRGHQQISTFFGKWLGAELQQLEAYKSVDLVVPVPLYKTRLRHRGYNQVVKFGQEIAKALNVEFNDSVLIKTKATTTKVFKKRINRFDDDSVFDVVETYSLKGKHILLVDDLITTGATLEACATALFKIEGITLSFAAMAITD